MEATINLSLDCWNEETKKIALDVLLSEQLLFNASDVTSGVYNKASGKYQLEKGLEVKIFNLADVQSSAEVQLFYLLKELRYRLGIDCYYLNMYNYSGCVTNYGSECKRRCAEAQFRCSEYEYNY